MMFGYLLGATNIQSEIIPYARYLLKNDANDSIGDKDGVIVGGNITFDGIQASFDGNSIIQTQLALNIYTYSFNFKFTLFSTSGYTFLTDSTTRVVVGVYNNNLMLYNNNGFITIATNVIDINTEYNVVVVFDGDKCTINLNGITYINNITPVQLGAFFKMGGEQNNTAGLSLDGTMRNFNVYGRALTESEINILANQ